ncbi:MULTISPECIES: hypothetical protein [Paenibacillus]|uniref:Uncharacterized protein n=1 Tax=Paenibacillus odorifer TaxID=189426 RepID=A0AB36J6Z4_9BACL|nr:hypothetical protein [Paenibacillus odorifer]OMD21347.1 hypothetical protein BJP48_30220 [Paenibacillus odorifer]OME05987.1 hypothetical protein BSK60_32945 [Paenibacillus odorifer]OME10526.1 hypothetical protein BSK47_30440 [Paenibacillus odorifer]
MKKKIIILTSTVIALLIAFLVIDHLTNDPKKSAYERAMSKPVPTSSVELFEKETFEIVRIYDEKSKDLLPLTEDEETILNDYYNNYSRNPRLSGEQESIYSKIVVLETSYYLFISSKDSKEKEDIKTANEAITSFFSYLEGLKTNKP